MSTEFLIAIYTHKDKKYKINFVIFLSQQDQGVP